MTELIQTTDQARAPKALLACDYARAIVEAAEQEAAEATARLFEAKRRLADLEALS